MISISVNGTSLIIILVIIVFVVFVVRGARVISKPPKQNVLQKNPLKPESPLFKAISSRPSDIPPKVSMPPTQGHQQPYKFGGSPRITKDFVGRGSNTLSGICFVTGTPRSTCQCEACKNDK